MIARRSILYLDPYHTASHRLLAQALESRSRHAVTLLTLPPRKWKWRMRGASFAFEPMVRALPGPHPELLVTTDFLNLPEFLALTRDLFSAPIRAIVYFHENQLTYPSASSDVRDFHFGLVNIHSALAADRALFNSDFHREDFIAAAEDLLRRMPDFPPSGVGDRIRARSEVIGLPLDLAEMDARRTDRKMPWVVWNHRWEEDRDPAVFFEAMAALDRAASEGRVGDFRLVVAGQTYQERPAIFDQAKGGLAHRIERWGFVDSRSEYLDLLARSAVVVSTSRHEFFGVSVMEAIYLGCSPVLPRRLTYPEIVDGERDFLYDDPSEIPRLVAAALERFPDPRVEALAARIRRHDAAKVIARWDEIIEEICG